MCGKTEMQQTWGNDRFAEEKNQKKNKKKKKSSCKNMTTKCYIFVFEIWVRTQKFVQRIFKLFVCVFFFEIMKERTGTQLFGLFGSPFVRVCGSWTGQKSLLFCRQVAKFWNQITLNWCHHFQKRDNCCPGCKYITTCSTFGKILSIECHV